MNPENICKRIWIFVFCKNLSNKYSQKRLNSTKKLDTIKTASKKAIQKTAHATGDLIANKITDKITSVSAELPSKKKKNTTENNNTNNETEVPRERYISSEKRQQIIDELKLV